MAKNTSFIRSISIIKDKCYDTQKEFFRLLIRVGNLDELMNTKRTTFTCYEYDLLSDIDALNHQLEEDLMKDIDLKSLSNLPSSPQIDWDKGDK